MDQVYQDHPATLAHLKGAIIRNVRGIIVNLLRSAVEHTCFTNEKSYGESRHTYRTSIERLICLQRHL